MRRDAHRDEQNHMTTLIQTPAALAAHAARWAQCAWLTLDTEFVRVDPYYPKLCLVQIGDPERAVCIATLALDALPPLSHVPYAPTSRNGFPPPSKEREIRVRRLANSMHPLPNH